MGRPSKTKICLVVLLYVLSGIACWVGGSYFLHPYYSISRGLLIYDGNQPENLTSGSFLTTVRTTTDLTQWTEPLFIRSMLSYDPSSSHLDSNCSLPYFQLAGTLDPPPYGLDNTSCVQVDQYSIGFLNVDTDTDNTALLRSVALTETTFTIAEVPFLNNTLRLELWQQSRNSSMCHTAADCVGWAQEEQQRFNQTEYEGSAVCYRGSCAVPIHLGNRTECFGDVHSDFFDPFELHQASDIKQCSFVSYYQLFHQPPAGFTVLSLWTWGNVAFVSILSIWAFSALAMGRDFHTRYLRTYHIHAVKGIKLVPGAKYDYKLLVSGAQFTRARGSFKVMAEGPQPSYQHDRRLDLKFDEEDVEDSKVHTVEMRGSFVADEAAASHTYTYHMQWNQEFSAADYDEPRVQIVMRRSIPPTVKSRLNVFVMPLFWVCIGTCYRKKFVAYKEYCILVIFFTLAQTALAFSLVMILASLLIFYEPIRNLFWGTDAPLVLYILFVLCVAGILSIHLLQKTCRVFRKGGYDMRAHDAQSARMGYSTDEKSEENAVVLNTRKSRESIRRSRPVSHLDVDYVALEDRAELPYHINS